ncbi:hypothetical protein AVEN_6984-1 [Araneus ventricosus]|uniref:Uncharacterized protein n=1 Tax=Araneus ventricosus TaxID=182803 RepID=A0A4Y2I5E1_ARAVE|nr:hypothetical protein AVEN_6984-1 [Araneus ventricosus]
MIILRARLLSQQIAANVCRTFSTEKTSTPKYWHAKFPDKKPRSFDEMPTVEEPQFDPYKSHEIFPQWFKKYGYVVKQPVGNGKYTVHTFHFDDFDTVYKGDTAYYRATRKPPQRLSHQVLKHYRENNKDLYDNVGLGPGDGDYVGRIRDMIRESMSTGIDEKLENVADDLIEIIRDKVGEGGEIELLPWLFRWGFENVGLKFLDKRLGALSQTGNEEADKMVEAAAITNEMVVLTTLDPVTDYAERYQKVESSEGYFYSVLKKYIDEIASQPDSKCAVKKILENNPKDAITVTLDGFQGALQTVPLTVLMALYNVARNEDIQAQAREELVEYLPTKDSKYCSLNISPPDIIEHIVWETLRYVFKTIFNM